MDAGAGPFARALADLKSAYRLSVFNTFRLVARQVVGEAIVTFRHEALTPRSIVHVSCTEAVCAPDNVKPDDYIGIIGDAEVSAETYACSNGSVTIKVRSSYFKPIDVLLGVTIFSEAQATVFCDPKKLDFPGSLQPSNERIEYLCNTERMTEGTDEQFVEWVYWRYLDREPDPNGRAHHLDLLDKGMARAEIVKAFLHSDEYRARQGGAG